MACAVIGPGIDIKRHESRVAMLMKNGNPLKRFQYRACKFVNSSGKYRLPHEMVKKSGVVPLELRKEELRNA